MSKRFDDIKTTVTAIYYEYPSNWVVGDKPLEDDDFEKCSIDFEGADTAEALLDCFSYFGYISNKDNFIKNVDELGGHNIDAVFRYVGIYDDWVGINGPDGDFIYCIEDENGEVIFEDYNGFAEWKSQFKGEE